MLNRDSRELLSTFFDASVEDGVVNPVFGRDQLIQNMRASGRNKDLLDLEWFEGPDAGLG